MKSISFIMNPIRRLLSSPRDEMNRWQRALRFSIDLSWHCAKELKHDKAPQMAAALTYRTIFSLIPILVISLVVFNAWDGFRGMRDNLQMQALEFLNLNSLSLEVLADEDPSEEFVRRTAMDFNMIGGPMFMLSAETFTAPADPDAADAQKEQKANRAMVVDLINQTIDKIENLNFESMGKVGFLVLIWAAMALVISMETSFNQIYGAAEGRSLAKRITVYWSALTLGPVLLVASVAIAVSLMEAARGLEERLLGQSFSILGTLLKFLSGFGSIAVTWLLLVFLYSLMPNTRVQLRSAAAGALVAAVGWELAKWAFGLYVQIVVPFSRFYGSLGLIPLFLFWVYLTWLIILFGLELSYTLQAMKGRQFKHARGKQSQDDWIDTAWMVPLAARIAESFANGRSSTVDDLAERLSLPQRSVLRLIKALESAGIVHSLAEDGTYSLAKPADRIAVANILEAGQALLPTRPSDNGDPAWNLVRQLHAESERKLQQQTLSDLCVADTEKNDAESGA